MQMLDRDGHERNRTQLELFHALYGGGATTLGSERTIAFPLRGPARSMNLASLTTTSAAQAAAAARIDLSTIPADTYAGWPPLRGKSRVVAYLDDAVDFKRSGEGVGPEEALRLGRQCGKSLLAADLSRAELLRTLLDREVRDGGPRYLSVPDLYRGFGPTLGPA